MEFCIEYGVLEPFPARLEVVLLYVTRLADRLCYSSIRQYIGGLWQLHKVLGYQHIDPNAFELYITLRGIRRVLGDTVEQARPASINDLRNIFVYLNMDSSEDVAFWVAIILCFRGLLRKSNVVEVGLALGLPDLEWEPWGVSLRLRRTKTISFKERVLYIPFSIIPGSIFCLHYYLVLLISMVVYPSETAQVVGYMKLDKFCRGSYTWYLKKLKALCVKAGVEQLTTHSLRRGGASVMADNGFSLLDIRNVGDWKSLSVLHYLTKSPVARLDLDRRIVNAVFV
jgi:hypothetical protein